MILLLLSFMRKILVVVLAVMVLTLSLLQLNRKADTVLAQECSDFPAIVKLGSSTITVLTDGKLYTRAGSATSRLWFGESGQMIESFSLFADQTTTLTFEDSSGNPLDISSINYIYISGYKSYWVEVSLSTPVDFVYVNPNGIWTNYRQVKVCFVPSPTPTPTPVSKKQGGTAIMPYFRQKFADWLMVSSAFAQGMEAKICSAASTASSGTSVSMADCGFEGAVSVQLVAYGDSAVVGSMSLTEGSQNCSRNIELLTESHCYVQVEDGSLDSFSVVGVQGYALVAIGDPYPNIFTTTLTTTGDTAIIKRQASYGEIFTTGTLVVIIFNMALMSVIYLVRMRK